MFAFAAGRLPATRVRACSAPLVAVIAITILEVGCASNNGAYYAEAPAVAAYAARSPGVQTEDDGLPSQMPPSPRIRQMPDDPTEPYSRNYGGPNPSALKPSPSMRAPSSAATAVAIPADLPPDFRHKLIAEVAKAD